MRKLKKNIFTLSAN